MIVMKCSYVSYVSSDVDKPFERIRRVTRSSEKQSIAERRIGSLTEDINNIIQRG